MKLFDNKIINILIKSFFDKKRLSLISVFVKNEGKELLGSKNTNFIKLIIVLFITYLALGLSKGSLDYLSDKMNDPFIKALSTAIPSSKAHKAERIISELNKEELNKKFLYKQVDGHFGFGLMLYNNKRNTPIDCYGRTVEVNDPVLHQVFQKKNLKKWG